MLDRWLVVISGPELIEEVRKFPDDQVSFLDAVEEVGLFLCGQRSTRLNRMDSFSSFTIPLALKSLLTQYMSK